MEESRARTRQPANSRSVAGDHQGIQVTQLRQSVEPAPGSARSDHEDDILFDGSSCRCQVRLEEDCVCTEEGAIQVFRPHLGGSLLLGAIGQLQFEVVAHRLKTEYGVETRFLPARYQMARWVTSEDPNELKKFIEANAARIAWDTVEAPTFMVTYRSDLTVAEERWKKIRFHAMREHAGLVFQSA